MVRKSLHNPLYFDEIIKRIYLLSENSSGNWGKMSVSQMLFHCHLILQIPLKNIDLPKANFFIMLIGITAKKEMWLFNNGIPHNMPTFQKLIVNFECDFEMARKTLLQTLKDYLEVYNNNQLPENHALFGKMKEKDWGFLEYKHLDHHLKQFNV
ncbi:DUF1569 domain-containing protein [Chryseobacterium sp.]|uniref:DUF1569 domain-containing protein n=1 Tax=Chryseobacterium sp. TaxID=1871047 RepID=UPI0025C34EBC|nr:DUF1569 domain-containing protein [Chryseobacterium sp.]